MTKKTMTVVNRKDIEMLRKGLIIFCAILLLICIAGVITSCAPLVYEDSIVQEQIVEKVQEKAEDVRQSMQVIPLSADTWVYNDLEMRCLVTPVGVSCIGN